MPLTLDALRRWPDLEGPELVAADAADRLILDESAPARVDLDSGALAVIGDAYGALTLGAADDGARSIRVHQDPLTGERALAANAETFDLADTYELHPLEDSAVAGARVVVVRLPRSLDELRDIAGLIAAHADPDVVVYAGGRIKHMTPTMNDVLREFFATVDVTHARQKSRVLVARGPHDGRDPVPRVARHEGTTIYAYGGVFAGTSIDIGTRLLLSHLPLVDSAEGGTLIDMACGTGIVAVELARQHPDSWVIASDQSAAAVGSARLTVAANDGAESVTVVRDDLLRSQPDASAALIALNPPFHSGAAIQESIAPRMFADAGRVLRRGGELWTVWNSALQYRPALERLVGPTRQVARNTKFTVTASTKR